MSDTTPRQTDSSPPGPLELTPPAPVTALRPESASGHVKLSAEDLAELDAQVKELVGTVARLDAEDPKLKDCAERIRSLGNPDIEQAANLSSRFLERPLASLKNGLLDTSSPVSRAH